MWIWIISVLVYLIIGAIVVGLASRKEPVSPLPDVDKIAPMLVWPLILVLGLMLGVTHSIAIRGRQEKISDVETEEKEKDNV